MAWGGLVGISKMPLDVDTPEWERRELVKGSRREVKVVEQAGLTAVSDRHTDCVALVYRRWHELTWKGIRNGDAYIPR